MARGVLYSEIIDNKGEFNRSSVVLAQTWNDRALVVASHVEALFEEVVAEAASLRQAIHAAGTLNVYPPVRCGFLIEVIFLYYFFRNVDEFYLGVFWSFEWCHKVEVGKIGAHKMCTRCGNDAVEEYFDEEECCHVGTHVIGIVDEVSAHDCSCAVGFLFLCSNGTDEFDVGDIFELIAGDVCFVDDFNGVGAFY